MNWERVVSAATRPSWVDSFATTVQGFVARIYEAAGPVGQQVQNLLHGTWLGHPLHPLLTHVPVGAWTVALTFDLLDAAAGQKELAAGADLAVAVGVLGALGAAAAGLTDWYKLAAGQDKRVGMVHALFNVSATTLYAASLFFRRNGLRTLGRGLAFAGFGAVSAGGYLGGHLVYRMKIGVDHVTEELQPAKFEAALPEAELAEGKMRRVEIDDTPVLLARRNGVLYALADTCSHLGCSLAKGELKDGSVRCPCHGSRYALEDGRVLDGPSVFWQPVYRVRVKNGQIEVGKRREV
jgi:nitrite reductase/ring-hydroxylating ferredoxin subunit/uncharacterized membrane protein